MTAKQIAKSIVAYNYASLVEYEHNDIRTVFTGRHFSMLGNSGIGEASVGYRLTLKK